MSQRPSFLDLMRMERALKIALVVVLVFAILMSAVSIIHDLAPKTQVNGPPPLGPVTPPTIPQLIVASFNHNSLSLSLGSWICVIGLLAWRGRTRSFWNRLGFDQDVFQLFVKMRGAPTRLKMLQTLSIPKDRAQLAQELGIDWRAVDRHIQILQKYGFIEEKARDGTARFYRLTPSGNMLLNAIREQNENKES